MKRSVLFCFWMLLLCMTACVDDEIRSFDALPEGETTVNVTVEFQSLTPALATRAVAGDTIRKIRDLCVLVYGVDGKLIKNYPIKWKDGKVSGYIEGEQVRKGDTLAESATPYARFKLKLPYGRYHIYAVANMGDLTSPAEVTEAIQTRDGLKNISLTWQKDVEKNNQMLGHFTEKGHYADDVDGVIINRKNMELRAGIRRVVSKVTLAFDGSQLKEGVFVYVKSVQIKDIPLYCRLGNKNTVKASRDSLIEEGDTILYVASGIPFDEDYPARVTRGKPYYPHDDQYNKAFHSETERALFFFENMQGIHPDHNKQQDADHNGSLDHPGTSKHPSPEYRPKDGILYGTYIEVEAYYRSINSERLGNGDITYRFMLGKNVTTDYDAERNHHYKLTLRFKNFANDADWHIDYEEPEPSIQVPHPYYISYLYNHKMMLPVKVNAGNASLRSFTAKIDTNSWAPYSAPRLDYYRKLDPYNAQFNKDFNGGWGLRPWNGFLSLRRTKTKVIEAKRGENSEEINRKYYEDNNRGNRSYNVIPNINGYDDDDGDGKYYVAREAEGVTNFLLPMYTRAKQMIISSGYTGNNPFVAYQRKSVIEFNAVLSNGITITKHADIMQVRRGVNPKGIWRKWNSTRSFHVVLKRLSMENSTSFETFTSEGKWKAYPIIDPTGLVDLGGTDTIRGSTGSPVDFTIGFNGKCLDSTQNRCAIIRVEYHDYSCYHLIFVRQGGAPMALLSGKAKWLAGNMRTKTQEAKCPLEEGSLFKFGNWNAPIDATNNENDKASWVNVGPADFKDHKDSLFLIAGTDRRVKWSSITSLDTKTKSFDDVIITNNGKSRTLSVATIHDYEELYKSSDIEYAYGVLYGDEATETLTKVEEVYGYRYDECKSGSGGYGMRGTFVYNANEKDGVYGGRNLFFPIGASGYGHRKNSDAAGSAILRYSVGRDEQYSPETQLKLRPLFYDLYMRPGAIYWAKQFVSRNFYSRYEDDAIGWDFNYFTFDFNYISEIIKNDACFVRCVEK